MPASNWVLFADTCANVATVSILTYNRDEATTTGELVAVQVQYSHLPTEVCYTSPDARRKQINFHEELSFGQHLRGPIGHPMDGSVR